MSHRTLIVVFGQVRTLHECVLSIYSNLVLPNRPCHVVFAIDGKYEDIPSDVMQLFRHVLYDIYVTHNKDDDDLRRDHQCIEFCLVEQALRRIPHPETYEFILKIRTDIYLRYPIDMKITYGRCSPEKFGKAFTEFMQKAKIDWKKEPHVAVRAWFLTGGLPFFISKQLDPNHPPVSPWSTQNVYEWNAKFFSIVQGIFEKVSTKINLSYMQFLIRRLAENERVVFLIGSTWIHFGLTKDILQTSFRLQEKHSTMTWDDRTDDHTLSWTDHKGTVRTKPQSEWKLVTDDQMRMVHHLHGYTLMDLVNPVDYIESFDAMHPHHQNKKNPNMFAWIVRDRQLSSSIKN